MTYIETTSILAEVTESISHPGGGGEITINAPRLNNSRPLMIFIAQASSDFDIKVGASGEFQTVDSSGLTTDAQHYIPYGKPDTIKIRSASANNIIIRWMFQHPRVTDLKDYRAETFSISQGMAESEIQPPPGTVEMSITSISGNTSYRIDEGNGDGDIILDSNKISPAFPYNIPIYTRHHLYMLGVSGAVTIQGHWIISR